MSRKPHPTPRTPSSTPAFVPAPTRARRDGWTPERQARFVEALAQSGCVTEACASVGMSKQSAYALRMRGDAQGFRLAWEAAQDLAIRRLSDECLSRALHGEVVPHFYKGELVGEHRRYDNKLATFLLRYRDPLRYAATLDQMVYAGHPEQAALAFMKAFERMMEAAHGAVPLDEPENEEDEAGEPPPPPGSPPWTATPIMEELDRQREQALAAGNAPIGGSHARRARFRELRGRMHDDARKAEAGRPETPDLLALFREQWAKEDAAAGRPDPDAPDEGSAGALDWVAQLRIDAARAEAAGVPFVWPTNPPPLAPLASDEEAAAGGAMPSASSTSAPPASPAGRPGPRITRLDG